jgi:hypothetical protein
MLKNKFKQKKTLNFGNFQKNYQYQLGSSHFFYKKVAFNYFKN